MKNLSINAGKPLFWWLHNVSDKIRVVSIAYRFKKTIYFFTDKVNPIALKKTKIVCNFGLSECNRVNNLQLAQCYEVLSMKVLSGLTGEIPY